MMTLLALDLDRDVELVQQWVTHPKAAFWLMQGADIATVRAAYTVIADHPHHAAFLGLNDGQPAFLTEKYDPRYVELVGLYDPQPGDVGMHVLVAPTDTPVHGFTRDVMTALMAWLFTDPDVLRVVVEPDVRNTAIHVLNAAVGFEVVGTVHQPEKDALLSTCTREQFHHALGAVPC